MLRARKFLRPRLIGRFNHYTTLGVDKSSDTKAIKKAFRQKSLQCHPDKFPGNAAKESEFKRLSEAYQVLSNKDRRSTYDQTQAQMPGSAPSNNAGGQSRPFHEGHNRFRGRAAPDYNKRNYRSESSQFERNEQWFRVHEELNKQRHEQFSRRNPDFADFMNGRKGTTFQDFSKSYKGQKASDFEKGGSKHNWTHTIYEKHTFGSDQRMQDAFKRHQF